MIAISLMALHGVIAAQTLPLLHTDGTRFANSNGEINLRGLNISNAAWGFWQWPLSDSLQSVNKDPLIKPLFMKNFVFTPADVKNIQTLGSNVARYQINYELFAPGNPLRNANIDTMRTHIARLESIGVYTVICLSMQPGLNVQNDNYEKDKPPAIRLKSVFESDSIFVLWRNMWQFVAQNMQDMNAIAGYELLNEPRKPATADITAMQLQQVYAEIIDSIRKEDSSHIIFMPGFNSREANPGEQYWNNNTQQFVTDAGEQGIIWEKEFFAVPDSIPNIAYITHIYDPTPFTLFGDPNFDQATLKSVVADAATWAQTKGSPLFVSEYGVSYEHTFNHEPEKRMAWVTQVHALFEQYNISSAYFQYKSLLTPFVNLKAELGLWFQYYDKITVANVSNGVITYDQTATYNAAIANGVDSALKAFFIQNNQLADFSILENIDLLRELRRYFGNTSLSTNNQEVINKKEQVYLSSPNELTIVTDLIQTGPMTIHMYTLDGKRVLNTSEGFYLGKGTVNVSALKRSQLFVVEYGTDEKIKTAKILIP